MVATRGDALLYKIENENLPITSTKKSPWKIMRSRNEMIRLLSKCTISETRKPRLVLSDASLARTVRYILKSNHVQQMVWGMRRIIIFPEEVRFPLLVKKIWAEAIWRKYGRAEGETSNGLKMMFGTTFMEILRQLT